jgi:hypothetical protein
MDKRAYLSLKSVYFQPYSSIFRKQFTLLFSELNKFPQC